MRESYDRYMYRKYQEYVRTVNQRKALFDVGYMIIDDVLDIGLCEQLRAKALGSELIEDQYLDYKAVNYTSDHCNNSDISELVCNTIPSILEKEIDILKTYQYQRGWYFIHDLHQTQSVSRHTDPNAYITCNLWVTPEEHIDDTSEEYNGMILHTNNGSVTIPYKYNRMTMFLSQLEHESQLSRFKQNKVNFTFLYK